MTRPPSRDIAGLDRSFRLAGGSRRNPPQIKRQQRQYRKNLRPAPGERGRLLGEVMAAPPAGRDAKAGPCAGSPSPRRRGSRLRTPRRPLASRAFIDRCHSFSVLTSDFSRHSVWRYDTTSIRAMLDVRCRSTYVSVAQRYGTSLPATVVDFTHDWVTV